MRQLFIVHGGAPDLPLFGEIYLKREAPIIRADLDGVRRIEVASWGKLGPAAAKGPVTNIRNLTSPYWRTALQTPARRCLVPMAALCAWTAKPDPATGRKRKVWSEICDSEPFVFVGIAFGTGSDQVDRFALLTCAPITVVGTIYARRYR